MSSVYNETRVNLKVAQFNADNTPKTDEKTGEQVFSDETNLVEKKASEIIADYKAANKPEPEATKIQTFQYTEVTSSSELVSLLLPHNNNDADVTEKLAVAIINRGLVLAQQKAVRDFMLDSDQGAVEGVYDLLQDVKPGEGRRKADPATKAMKALSELLGRQVSQDELNTLLAGFAAPVAG